jgi:hypothetical protein
MDLTQLTEALSEVDPLVWVVLGAVLLLLVLVAVLLTVRLRRRRRRLRTHYGAEYEHTARRAGSPRQADRELLAREEHRRSYEVRSLEAGERERFHARWEALQTSFVDGPQTALQGADALLAEVAGEKGYDGSEGDPLRDVSVDHPLALDRYRAARASGTRESDRPDTETLRVAMLAARELFETLVGRETPEAASPATAFSELVDEDEADRPGPARDPDTTRDPRDGTRDPGTTRDPRDGTPASDPAGEQPLYGPDGRPLEDETRHPGA